MPAFSSLPEEAQFMAQAPRVDFLRSQYPSLKERLCGEFRTSPIVDKQSGGSIVSWEFDQGKTANPQLIRFAPGNYKFRTNYHEAIVVLEGGEACVNIDGYSLSQGSCMPIPANSEISMYVNRAVLIWKQFKPEQEMGRAFIVMVEPQALKSMLDSGDDLHDLIVGNLHTELCHERGDYLTIPLFQDFNPDDVVAKIENLTSNSPVAILATNDRGRIGELQALCQFAWLRYNETPLTII